MPKRAYVAIVSSLSEALLATWKTNLNSGICQLGTPNLVHVVEL